MLYKTSLSINTKMHNLKELQSMKQVLTLGMVTFWRYWHLVQRFHIPKF